MMQEPDRISDRKYPIAFAFRVECVDSNGIAQVELIAVRDAGTTKEDILAEFSQWNLGEPLRERPFSAVSGP